MADLGIQATGDFSLQSLRGGYDDETPVHLLPEDACTVANNVEFYFAALGERRGGATALDMTSSSLDDEAVISHLSKHNPTINEQDAELWGAAATFSTSVSLARRVGASWFPVTISDTPVKTSPTVLQWAAQTLHGKHFLLYKSNKDRIHVWDGSALRRAGLAQPDPPTAANQGIGTLTTDTRYYRIRIITKSGSDILLRSEPSTEISFTPSGTGLSVRVTRPTLPGEGETHWEVEASTDDAFFYRIAEVAIGTTFYDDSQPFASGFADLGPLSEDVGEYLTIPSMRYVVADQDRLIFGGSWEDNDHNARIAWTPVFNDPGAGNDERLPLTANNTLDLDTFEGGGLSGLASPVNGTVYAFKFSQVFKLVRTGERAHAYEAVCLSKIVGALHGSVVPAIDEDGNPCVYFLDPSQGPFRVGPNGLQRVRGVRNLWRRVNTGATNVACFGLYHQDKQQVHWWVALDGANSPNYKIIVHVNEQRQTQDGGVMRGLATADGKVATAYCGCIMSEFTEHESGGVAINYRPYVGLTDPDFILRCDVGITDNETAYVARVRSRPFFNAGLLNLWGSRSGALLATAATADDTVAIRCVRDFGTEINEKTVTLEPVGAAVETRTHVVKTVDDLVMSESVAIQFEFGDPT